MTMQTPKDSELKRQSLQKNFALLMIANVLTVSILATMAFLVNDLGLGIFIFALSVIIATLLALRLQYLISTPILTLRKIMNTVSITKDYSIRITCDRNDEIGDLFFCFNNMLHEIDQQTRALSIKQKILEEKTKMHV